jgi:predicted nucleic acid-binding protein
LNVYLDASALVKRYVDEPGSDVVLKAMRAASCWSMCRIGFVETVRAVVRGGGREEIARLKGDWEEVDVIEVDESLAEEAARIAVAHRLRTLDALHLAAALRLTDESPTFATWDRDLHRAAREYGLRTLPAVLD